MGLLMRAGEKDRASRLLCSFLGGPLSCAIPRNRGGLVGRRDTVVLGSWWKMFMCHVGS